MSYGGLLHYFLGLEVHQAKDGVFISQRKYVRDLLNKFGMINYKPIVTPMNTNEKLQQEDGEEMAKARRFKSLVGGLSYLAHTRFDIVFSIHVISIFTQQPSKTYYGAAKRIQKFGILYLKVSEFRLCGFTDSNGQAYWMIDKVF